MAEWQLPADIRAELSQKLRRCPRCGYHVADFSPRAAYCRPCTNAAAREYRARKKAEGGPPPAPRSRTCKPCQRTLVYPSGEWSLNNAWCKSCTNARARERRKGNPVPERRFASPGREPYQACRLCKRRKLVRAKDFPNPYQPELCAACIRRRSQMSYQALKAREGYVECHQCGESKWHPAGGAGWSGNRCPDCSRVAERERYAQKRKGNPDHARKEHLRYMRRKARAAEEADFGPSAGVGGFEDGQTPETPGTRSRRRVGQTRRGRN